MFFNTQNIINTISNAITLKQLLEQSERNITPIKSPQVDPPKLVPRNNTPADIWSFLSHFKNGIAKPTKYRLEFTLPAGVSGTNQSDVNTKALKGAIQGEENRLNKNDSVSIKCHTMTFPPRAFQTIEAKQNNMTFKMPFAITYEPVTFTFYADKDMDTKQYFDVWQSAVMNYSNNTMNFMNEYTSDIKLYILDDYGNDVYGVTLFQAYPMTTSMIEMSYANTNALLNHSVTFVYKYYLSMDSSQRVNR